MWKTRCCTLLLAELFFLLWFAGCAKNITPIAQTAPVPIEATRPDEQPTGLIADILASPNRYAGQSVTVVGYYRGWDVLHEIGKAPPVSRNDWVIADSSGVIYVTGLVPTGLDPSSSKDTATLVRLSAQVEYDEEKEVVYLKAENIELLGK